MLVSLFWLYLQILEYVHCLEKVLPQKRLPIETEDFAFCGQISNFNKDFTQMDNERIFEDKAVSKELITEDEDAGEV